MGKECPKCQTNNPDTQKFCGECATPLPSQKEIPVTKTLETPTYRLTKGTTFASRYEIIEELGKGGMGRVYRVKDQKLNEEMALKVLKPEIAAYKETIERFKNELKFARKIAHRNVCKMYDLNEEEETPYITMEYVKGEDLKSVIRRKGLLTKEETIAIAKQVCEGLAEAHELGVIHRDLKPQNIMIDEKNNAKVMDFGISRSVEAPGVTQTGMMIGTPDYMSPEQAEGEEADQRSDIYSLGVILYEMVTGNVPFKGDTALSVALKHKTKVPQDPRKLNPEVSEELSRLILICMEKDKERRYKEAEELLADLRNIEDDLPLGTKIRPRRATFIAALIRKKLFIPALVFAAIIITAMIIWQLLFQKETDPSALSGKPSLAVMYFENNTGEEGLDHWRKALSELLISDLSQSKYLRILSGDRIFHILRQLNLLDAKSYSSEDLKKVTERGRVANILRGSFIKAGDTIRINITLQKAETGELIGSESVEGKGEKSFFSMVDELTRRIKSNFKLSSEQIASDRDKGVGEITTNIPAAYKYYIEGIKYHYTGDYRQSISFMKRAVELDPEFAMAYRAMSASYGNWGTAQDIEQSNINLRKAFELSDRVSDKERYWIQGDYYRGIEKKYDKAIEAYNIVLELDPVHITRNNIGLIYYYLEEWDKAIEHFEVLRKNKTESFMAYWNLGICYAAKGMYKKAREACWDYIRNFPDNALIHGYIADLCAFEGKYDLALEEADKAIALNPQLYSKGRIYYLEGRFDLAEKEYKKLLDGQNELRWLSGRRRLANLYITQGKFENAQEQGNLGLKLAEGAERSEWASRFHYILGYCSALKNDLKRALQQYEKALDITVKNDIAFSRHELAYYKARTYVEMGSLDEAKKAAEDLRKVVEDSIHPKNIRFYHHLMALIEFKKKNYSAALDYFEKTISLVPAQCMWDYKMHLSLHLLFLYPFGKACYESGDFGKALELYEKMIALTSGRYQWGDLYVKSFYMLGKIYEQQGSETKAIEHYEKFLDLWKDADPGIAEVEDAKKRLAGLNSQ